MKSPVRVTDDIHWVGVNDYDTNLFEAIWPLPRGISYDAYLIADEQTALIDGVKGGPSARCSTRSPALRAETGRSITS